MTNYKQHDYETVGTIIVHPIKPNEKMVVLISLDSYLTAADSLKDMSTNTTYTVTSGKTLHIIEIRYYSNSATVVTSVISQGDTDNAETLTKIPYLGNTTQAGLTIFPCNITFASGKYVTFNNSAGSIAFIMMLGYET